MPEDLKRKLALTARKKGFKGERVNNYIYGTLSKLGLLHDEAKKAIKRRIGKK